ncbi:MAG: hypothetical protein ACI9RO_000812 [Alteromonas macleodii]|jgi:hypothetical protein
MNVKIYFLSLEKRYSSFFAALNLRTGYYFLRDVFTVIQFLKIVLIAPIAFVSACMRGLEGTLVVVATRNDYIGPCSLQLISAICARTDRKLVLSVKNRVAFLKINSALLEVGNFEVYKIVEQDSFSSLRLIFQAKGHFAFETVFETFIAANNPRVLFCGAQRPILIPDGVVTKTNGNLISSSQITNVDLKNKLVGLAAKRITYVSQSGADNYRTCLNTGIRSPSIMRQVGLPRFQRAKDLLEGKIAPILTTNFLQMIGTDTSKYRVIVALTKNKESSDFEFLLKQMGLTVVELDHALKEADTSLWIKSHQSTLPINARSIDANYTLQNRIFAIGPADGLSSVDLFAHFDGLMTDISSIYVDFLPFDKPIGFIRYDMWKKEERFCYPDSPFYPGAKLNTLFDLTVFLSNLTKDDPQAALERDYARKVLLGDGTDVSFWSAKV